MAVYFAMARQSGNVKIGYTKGEVEKRISNLQTSSAEDLDLLYVVADGTPETEEEFHARFSRSHIKREWFRYDPEISLFLNDFSVRDRVELFKYRAVQKYPMKDDQWFLSYLLARVELDFLRRDGELEDLFEIEKELISDPVSEEEKDWLLKKRRKHAQKNG